MDAVQEVLVNWWPVVLAVLAAFLKPGDKPIWKIVMDAVVKPKTPSDQPKPDVLSLVPMLLERLANKPPAVTDKPKTPAIPSTPQDVVSLIMDLLSGPAEPEKHDHDNDDVAQLLRCANIVAAKHPDSDVKIVIDASGATATVVKRVQQK